MAKKIENGHTQGRWVYAEYSFGGGAYIGVSNPNAANYDPSNFPIFNVKAVNPFYKDSEESKKVELQAICNYRLIAQAPEMYKYLAKKAAEGDKEAASIIKRCAVYVTE